MGWSLDKYWSWDKKQAGTSLQTLSSIRCSLLLQMLESLIAVVIIPVMSLAEGRMPLSAIMMSKRLLIASECRAILANKEGAHDSVEVGGQPCSTTRTSTRYLN